VSRLSYRVHAAAYDPTAGWQFKAPLPAETLAGAQAEAAGLQARGMTTEIERTDGRWLGSNGLWEPAS
jgi:hypothetical protein